VKKSCNYCRAYRAGGVCELRYKNKNTYYDGVGSPIINSIPLENCQKPKTVEAFLKEIKT
jgi:hypothetical protein